MNQYNSYYLYQQYEKRGSQDWIPCYPNIFSVDGDGTMPLVMKKENDPDCGYTGDTEPIYRWYPLPITTDYICDECPVVQYRWENMNPSTDYYCDTTTYTKYYKQIRQYSYDSGTTWYDVTPPEYQQGSVYEQQSTDCGYVPPIEPQYRTTSGTPYCEGYDKYVEVYSQVSYDGGITWSTTATTPTLVEHNSVECGYIEPQYRTTSGTPYCEGADKYVEVYSQVSYDGGITWETTATTSSLTEECSSDCIAHIQSIDMTGKLYVGKYYDGSTHRSYNCSSDPVQIPNIIAPETTGYQDKNVANTGAYNEGIDPYIYIGSCDCEVAPYAFRSYAVTSHKCGVSFYFDSGLSSFGLSRGALMDTNIREIVLGNTSMTFSAGDDTFSGGSGDISEITSRLTSAGENCFMDGNFGSGITFNHHITLSKKAFYWTNFTTITFNSGFTIGNNSVSDVFTGKYGAKYTFVLNGLVDYYDVGIADSLRNAGHTVIDNRINNNKFVAQYSDGSSYSEVCSSDGALTSATTKPTGYQYTAMTSCTIGSCVTSISGGLYTGGGAFSGCRSLTSIDIPDSVTSIGQYAFRSCSGLTSCTIGSGVETIGIYAFQRCSGMTTCTIGSGSIGEGAFRDCSGLTTCTLGTGVTSIGTEAFSGCTSLTSIVIPDSVTTIGIQAFYGCSGMTNCTIGSGVTSIDGGAFWYCTSITSVTINAVTPPTLGGSRGTPFDSTNNYPIYVPYESVNAYKTASSKWTSLASRIQAIP